MGTGMIDLKGIRNIVLDLGGVILGLDVNRSIERLEELGFPPEENLDIIFTKHPFFLSYETGKINTDQFIEAMAKQLGNHTPREKILEAWNAMILGFQPETIDLLTSLRDKFRLFLLSNTNALHEVYYNDLLHKNHGIPNLKDIFEKVYYSHDLHMRKPDHEIFQHVLDDRGLKAGETLYIDDTQGHVKAAGDLGIQAYHLRYPEKITEVL
jgi:putative hydrolase of the HAD superfamily